MQKIYETDYNGNKTTFQDIWQVSNYDLDEMFVKYVKSEFKNHCEKFKNRVLEYIQDEINSNNYKEDFIIKLRKLIKTKKNMINFLLYKFSINFTDGIYLSYSLSGSEIDLDLTPLQNQKNVVKKSANDMLFDSYDDINGTLDYLDNYNFESN